MRFLHLTCGAAWLLLAVQTAISGEAVVGLSDTAPGEGRAIKTDQGYMTEYKMTIPGTSVTFEMVPIPGGKFNMGSPDAEEGREDNEGPQFEVEVSPFWMSKYELTWAEYRQYLALYGIFKEFTSRGERKVTSENEIDAITAPTELYDPSFTYEHGEDPDMPAVTMTQYAARQYSKWLSGITGNFYRLPTEAEWEYACRAGTQTAYSFGDDADQLGDYAWYFENSDSKSHKVGQKKPNPWGLYDMHGNVAEWTLDQVLEDGYKPFAGKTLKSAEALVWPKTLVPRAIRGGHWDDDAEACRSAARLGSLESEWKTEDPNLPLSPWWFTSDPTRGIGCRLVRPLAEPATRETKERFWAIDDEDTREGVNNRMNEGRGVRGLVDRDLPEAIKKLKESR
ncbi:MAG: formylglycine-generating enzyme family protein [Candidatus Anammoximicrobium sp.]|nr:formylglycine-generating enzyme family protein [Candidatus Anammoximicrobium sp.]